MQHDLLHVEHYATGVHDVCILAFGLASSLWKRRDPAYNKVCGKQFYGGCRSIFGGYAHVALHVLLNWMCLTKQIVYRSYYFIIVQTTTPLATNSVNSISNQLTGVAVVK